MSTLQRTLGWLPSYIAWTRPLLRHTYLAQKIPWSIRGFFQGEAFPLHFGLADLCDRPKCGRLGCAIFVSGGLRSRYPSISTNIKSLLPLLPVMVCLCYEFYNTLCIYIVQNIWYYMFLWFDCMCLWNLMCRPKYALCILVYILHWSISMCICTAALTGQK